MRKIATDFYVNNNTCSANIAAAFSILLNKEFFSLFLKFCFYFASGHVFFFKKGKSFSLFNNEKIDFFSSSLRISDWIHVVMAIIRMKQSRAESAD